MFAGFGQQDSQEFLRSFLDRMHDEMKFAIGSKKEGGKEYRSIISDIFEGLLLSSVKCLQCYKVSLTKERFYDLSISIPSKTVMDKLSANSPDSSRQQSYGGWWSSIGSTIGNFLGCVSKNEDVPYTLLRLTRRTVLLEDCLQAFCTTEDLLGADRYMCEFCKTLTDGEKTFHLLRLPEVQ